MIVMYLKMLKNGGFVEVSVFDKCMEGSLRYMPQQ